MTCDGCLGEIAEGEHLVLLEVCIGTNILTGADWPSPEQLQQVQRIRLHNPLANPACFAMWAGDNHPMRDAFAE